jgi:hypothetical protein
MGFFARQPPLGFFTARGVVRRLFYRVVQNNQKDTMTKSRNVGRGGARPGAGRPPNKPQFESPEQRERYASAKTPLDYLLAVMRDPLADTLRRDKAAKAAAPYCHEKQTASKAAAD